MTINWRNPPSNFLDEVELARVMEALSLLKLTSGSAIESYTMSPDGPAVSSVFIVSEGYLCEIHLTTKGQEFDVCAADSVFNYRVKFGESEDVTDAESGGRQDTSNDVPQEDQATTDPTEKQSNPQKKVRFVEVLITHSDSLRSRLSYFGDDINNWLTYFLDVYPKKLLLK